MRGDNVPKAHTMRKTANDESGISNLSSVDFAKNLAYSDLTVGLKVCVSTSLETQPGYSLTDERDWNKPENHLSKQSTSLIRKSAG